MTEEKEFRGACYEAARRTGGRVAGFVPWATEGNFDQGHLIHGERTVAVLWTRAWYDHKSKWDVPGKRWDGLAIAEAPVAYGSIAFADLPELLAVLGELLPGVQPLTFAQLQGELDLAEWPWIQPGDMKYWKPESLGQALFNHWD
ncbi:hypothetical protein ACFQ05_12955 [Amycolatopsis umgeniensis]|uniref:Uncharacterized protein n=1 Tax=Amycolatopsis umgeniensis TaxID=336628 RepID=A0A841B6L9_9PSEU|nr:hypothetical protein [Amycolatopsis umgeniensis]MBB5854212.1 hypothetical protein [Amycolatopsis umgeniensis]